MNRKKSPNIAKLETVKGKLDNIYTNLTEGARIRAGIKWFEEGEKSSKLFHSLEKKKARERLWGAIKNNKGDIISGIENILKVQTEFYADLYKKVPIDVDACKNLLGDIGLTVKIAEKECELCEADLSLQEVEYVIKSLKRECSSGYDEITNEYNQVYWSLIKEEFVNVINEINKEGQMCNTQSMGIITLLYKNGDRNDITNWRPITLLNNKYKITEKNICE